MTDQIEPSRIKIDETITIKLGMIGMAEEIIKSIPIHLDSIDAPEKSAKYIEDLRERIATAMDEGMSDFMTLMIAHVLEKKLAEVFQNIAKEYNNEDPDSA